MRRAAALALVLCAGGCPERRKPIKVASDGGPAVVVIEPIPRAKMPAMPLADEKEPDDDLAHAQPLEPGKGIRGTIGPARPGIGKGKPVGDEDLFSFVEQSAAPDGGFLEVRVQLTGVAGVDLLLEALDGDGRRLWLANDGAAGEGETIANLATTPGHPYFLRVRAAQPLSAESAPYQLTLAHANAPANAEREPNDSEDRATPLGAMTDANGYYGKRKDEDWLRLPVAVDAPAGGAAIVRVELSAVEGVAPQLRLLAGQTVLAAAKGQKGDELRLRNVAVPGGVSPLAVVRAGEGRNPEQRWLLKVGVEPPLDGAEKEPNDTVQTATPIARDQTLSGFLWPGDVDVYCEARDDAAPHLSSVEVEGVDGVDLKLDRLGVSGQPAQHADDSGAGKGEALPPADPACVRVSGRARDTAFDAPYRLTVRAVPITPDVEREPNGSAQQATPWPDGAATMRGWLAPRGDEDWFRFTAPAGKTRVTARVDGTVTAVVRLSDEAKAPLGPATGGATASGPVTGGQRYFVSIKAQSEKGSNPRDPYTLSLIFE